MKLSIYLAGPMRGKVLFGFPAFDSCRDHLADMGWEVVSPADMDRAAGFDPAKLPHGTDWAEHPNMDIDHAILRDIKALKECDAIALLPGWQDSKGARAEAAVAEFMDKIRIDPETGLHVKGWA